MPYAAYGPDAVSAQAALNRPAYASDLVATWLPALPELNARLADTRQPGPGRRPGLRGRLGIDRAGRSHT